MGIWWIVKQPRRVLGRMKEKEMKELSLEAEKIGNEARNRLNGYDLEPDADLFERLCVARVFELMVRAVRRKRIESEGRGSYPGRPKPAARRRGENMSRARGAEN